MNTVELVNDSMSEQVQQCQRLARVLRLTQDMLQLADEGEWEGVAELEQERRGDLMACFSQAQLASDTDLVAEAMATLLHFNEELMAKLKVARSAVMEQGLQFTKNRSAVGCYRTVDASHKPDPGVSTFFTPGQDVCP